MSQLTAKRRKFADAFHEAYRGDTSKAAAVKAACTVAGYPSPTQGYRALKNDAVVAYLEKRNGGQPSRVDTQPQPTNNLDALEEQHPSIVSLESIRDDTDAPAGARVRANELLLKVEGKEKPAGEEEEEDPQAALEALLIMLGVDEVTPADFHKGQHKTWTATVLP